MSRMNRQKRVGIDARLWQETGVGRYIRNLILELAAIDRTTEYVLFLRKHEYETLPLPGKNFSKVLADIQWHTVAEQFTFPKLLAKEQLDLVHFPYFSVPIFYNRPYVLTIHDLILHHFPTGKASTHSWLLYRLKHAAYKYIIATGAKHAEKIIAVSHATKDEIVKHLGVAAEKIIVSYEGVDTKITNHEVRMANVPQKYFLYVGNAYPHKNLERLIEAFSKVKGPVYPSEALAKEDRVTPDNTKDLHLIIVGKKDFFYDRLEQKVKSLGLADSIIFKHAVSDEELSVLYAHALALVMPSLMEGFGLPLLEAMEQGCLVAASDIPAFREIGANIPLLFQPKDTRSIANVLESIANGEITDAEERKRNGKALAKKFSWKDMAARTQKVYESCLGLRPGQ